MMNIEYFDIYVAYRKNYKNSVGIEKSGLTWYNYNKYKNKQFEL